MEDMKNLKKIDIHVHAVAFPQYSPRTESGEPDPTVLSPEVLLKMYDELGIEMGVLLPLTSPEAVFTPTTSEMCKYMADQHPDRLLWFCSVDPRAVADMPQSNLAKVIEHYVDKNCEGCCKSRGCVT